MSCKLNPKRVFIFIRVSRKIIILIILVILISFVLDDYLSLSNIQKNLFLIKDNYLRHPFVVITLFLIAYILITSLSIPGAIFLTLLAGAVFGICMGTILVSFASTIGATFAFLLSRYILRDSIKLKFKEKYNKINGQFERRGNTYLFALRLFPASPYVVINLLMGLTKIKLINFFIITFVSMLPGNIIYVYAGLKISEINDTSEILTPPIILLLLVLSLLPFLSFIFPKITKEKIEFTDDDRSKINGMKDLNKEDDYV
jgi:uncharacterized membrane protein YdjX (TVP38/TMEM64 family)